MKTVPGKGKGAFSDTRRLLRGSATSVAFRILLHLMTTDVFCSWDCVLQTMLIERLCHLWIQPYNKQGDTWCDAVDICFASFHLRKLLSPMVPSLHWRGYWKCLSRIWKERTQLLLAGFSRDRLVIYEEKESISFPLKLAYWNHLFIAFFFLSSVNFF